MTYRVIRHPEVESDLENIAELIGDYAGLAIALSKIDEIERDMEGLANLPHIGSLRHEYIQICALYRLLRKAYWHLLLMAWIERFSYSR